MLHVNNDEFVFAQKYRPNTLKDCIIPNDLRSKLNGFISKGDLVNVLFYGPPGVGKTTVAKALVNDLNADHIFINCSKDRNIDTLRNQIAEYASSVSFSSGRKFVILDEADGLNQITQPALKAFMEEVSANCGFILTANHVNKIIPPLRSRCLEVPFIFHKDDRTALMKAAIIRILAILENEGHEITTPVKQVVATLVKRNFPDIRSVLNILQSYAASGTIDVGILSHQLDDSYENLAKILKEKNFKEMRIWASDNYDRDFANLVDDLYKEITPKIRPDSTPDLINILNKYDYQNAFVSNRELNVTSMLTTMMAELVFL